MGAERGARPPDKIKGAPDYDDAGYWDAKFANGQDVGEWLNPGQALLEPVLTALEQHVHADDPSVLHLGPGISKLGLKLCVAFAGRGWSSRGIVVSLERQQVMPPPRVYWRHYSLL